MQGSDLWEEQDLVRQLRQKLCQGSPEGSSGIDLVTKSSENIIHF